MFLFFSLIVFKIFFVFCFQQWVRYVQEDFLEAGVIFILSCLVFFEYPGFVVWCLLLILKNSQTLYLQIFLTYFLSFHSENTITYILEYLILSTTLGCSFFPFKIFFTLSISLHFSFGNFYWSIFKIFDSLLHCVEFTDNPMEGIFHLWHCAFLVLGLPSVPFL